jgi:hypothetical protein
VTDSETLRLAPPVIFWWVWVAFVAANVADYAAQGLPSARFGEVIAAILLLVTGLAFTLALRPKVIAGDDGITVVNPYRTHVVPWPLVTLVDTGEWVRIHYVPAPDGAGTGGPPGSAAGAGGAGGFAAAPGAARDSAGDKKVDCWALYVSTRARRKVASGPPRPRDPLSRGSLGLLGLGGLSRGRGPADDVPGATPGYASSSRLPDEAKYLASLPPARAMALRLDARAGRERARPAAGPSPRVTVTWSWPALAVVIVPAVILLAVALA